MSNHLAIATVTAALGNIVHASAKGAVPGTGLRFGRPLAPAANLRQANIYLYQALPYAALRNEDLPQRSPAGAVVRRPSAPVALHYLVSFYGDDASFEPDRMLGAVIRDLNATPMLLAGDIADALAGHAVLAGSDLAAGPARVKFSALPMTLDEMSRLWSVMIQTPFVLSTAWQAEVVQIDALGGVQPATPVLRRGPEDRGPETSAALPPAIDALWFGPAALADRVPLPPSMTAAMPGGAIRVTGTRIAGDALSAEIVGGHGLAFACPATLGSDGKALVLVPDDPAAAAALVAGPAGLRLTVTRGGDVQRSDVAPMLLAPRIVALAPDPLPGSGVTQLAVDCLPQVGPAQRALLRLGALEVAADPHPAATGTLSFAVDGATVADGTLAVLVVDGVASQPVLFDAPAGAFAFDDAQRVHVS
ncbi:DUF4255 domain-containing protein [Sphingomonas sp.]|uniref:DUF4255 domain-containing protein n=1 Tax=Sphingomonas sp. TaxID=28214 RepID=UPI0035BBAFDC